MQMNEKLDAGNIILQKKIEIKEKNTSQEIHDQLSQIGGELINNVLKQLEKKEQIKSIPQNETMATYAKKITTDETKINWEKSGKEILRQIKAIGGWFLLNKERVKIFDAEISSKKTETPGFIVDKNFSISCGKDEVISPKVLQKSGGVKMKIETFLRGFSFEINQKVD